MYMLHVLLKYMYKHALICYTFILPGMIGQCRPNGVVMVSVFLLVIILFKKIGLFKARVKTEANRS